MAGHGTVCPESHCILEQRREYGVAQTQGPESVTDGAFRRKGSRNTYRDITLFARSTNMLLTCKDTDNSIRWTEGERLDHLFEQRCDSFSSLGDEGHIAVVTDSRTYSFRDLDDRANQAARYLIAQGLESGDRVGL